MIQTLQEIIEIECPSETCRNEKRKFFYVGETGVAWNRKPLYMCPVCAYPMMIKLKQEVRLRT
jgi:hypothetical protein